MILSRTLPNFHYLISKSDKQSRPGKDVKQMQSCLDAALCCGTSQASSPARNTYQQIVITYLGNFMFDWCVLQVASCTFSARAARLFTSRRGLGYPSSDELAATSGLPPRNVSRSTYTAVFYYNTRNRFSSFLARFKASGWSGVQGREILDPWTTMYLRTDVRNT